MNRPINETRVTTPNRWDTPVTVEIYLVDSPSTFKAFSDLQMAYLWIKDLSLDFPQEWNISTFEETCRELDISYSRMGLRASYCVGQTYDCQYIVYYGVLSI